MGLSTRLLQQLLEVTCSSLTSADPSGFITFWREISENTICGCNTGKSCLLLHDDTALFCCVNFSTMHTASYEFLMKPKESAGCHQTLSSRVGSGYKTSHTRLTLTHVLYQGIVRACIDVASFPGSSAWAEPGNEASIYGDYYR